MTSRRQLTEPVFRYLCDAIFFLFPFCRWNFRMSGLLNIQSFGHCVNSADMWFCSPLWKVCIDLYIKTYILSYTYNFKDEYIYINKFYKCNWKLWGVLLVFLSNHNWGWDGAVQSKISICIYSFILNNNDILFFSGMKEKLHSAWNVWNGLRRSRIYSAKIKINKYVNMCTHAHIYNYSGNKRTNTIKTNKKKTDLS